MKKVWIILVTVFLPFLYVNSASAKELPKLKLASQSAILVDSKTGTVLYEKNAYEKMYPASITKIATAIYALENGNINDTITISSNVEETDGTRVYLVKGEKVTLKHLLQGLLINSGNDAGVAIAEYLSGSVDRFAKDLNRYLVENVGVSATHFVNPHGLFDESHFTTAYDMAKITNYAMQNEQFREIFGTKELDWDGKAWKTKLITHHLMLKGEINYKEVIGGKTGYVDESGQTLVTTAKNNHIALTVVILGAKTKGEEYSDTKKLLDYGFNHFETSTLPKDSTYNNINNKTLYKVPKNIYYTKPLHSEVDEKVSSKGILNIIDKTGMVIDSFQLSSIKVKAAENTSEVEPNMKSNNSTWLLYIIYMILCILIILLIKKLMRFRFSKNRSK